MTVRPKIAQSSHATGVWRPGDWLCRLTAVSSASRQTCRSVVSAVAVEVFVNDLDWQA